MATETLNWSLYGSSDLQASSVPQDTGSVIADPSVTITGTSHVTRTTTTGPTGTPYTGSGWVYMTNGTSSPSQTLDVSFSDDPSDGVTSAVHDASFYIGDIDGSRGYRDIITVRATDTDGNPLTVTATPNSSFTIQNNADGSVTITATTAGSQDNTSPFTWSQISVAGGPIADISVSFGNRPGGGSQVLYISNITYTTKEVVICFTRGTQIETDRGAIPVELLAQGDLIATRDHGLQPLRWIGSRRIDAARLARSPHLRPIRIRAGALGRGMPAQDLLVSPQHRILVKSGVAARMFGTDEVLVAAKQLLQMPGIDIAEPGQEVEYFHLLLDRHEIVTANGAESETLFTGPEAIKAISKDAAHEIFEIFPELRDRDYDAIPARPLAPGRMGRKLAVRHAQNHKPLVSHL